MHARVLDYTAWHRFVVKVDRDNGADWQVLTSDHEWCTYAELAGIGIHQLITGDGDDAVTTARFTWNGHSLTAAPVE